jgi:hypothetical protein
LLGLGCGDAPEENGAPSDVRLFLGSVRAVSHAEGRAACLAIQDGPLQAACLVDNLRIQEIDDQEFALGDCASMLEGPWRRECFFQAAEVLGGRGEVQEAIGLCAFSEDYAEKCEHHVLSVLSVRLLRAGMPDEEPGVLTGSGQPAWERLPLEAVQGRLPGAASEYAGLLGPLLGQGDARHTRERWSPLFKAFAASATPLDESLCEALDAAPKEGCERIVFLMIRSMGERAFQGLSPDSVGRVCRAQDSGRPVGLEALPALLGLDVRLSPGVFGILSELREQTCRRAARMEEGLGLGVGRGSPPPPPRHAPQGPR